MYLKYIYNYVLFCASEKEKEKKIASELMERLRSRAGQLKSWSDTTKALKMSMAVSTFLNSFITTLKYAVYLDMVSPV